MQKAKIVFLSFADCNMLPPLKRIGKEAASSGFFDDIRLKTDKDFDESYWQRYQKWYTNNKRGFGYWLWKSYFVKAELSRMAENDILVYADAGCEIHKEGKRRFYQYLKDVEAASFGLLVFTSCLPEYQWTKGDILDFFRIRNNLAITSTEQILAGLWIMRKSPKTVSFVEEWYNVCHNNFDLINDSPSKSLNLEGFIENRHDQSIFSILCKINGAVQKSGWEVQAIPSIPRKWSRLKDYPFWAARNRTGHGIMEKYPSSILPVLFRIWNFSNEIEFKLREIYHRFKSQ